MWPINFGVAGNEKTACYDSNGSVRAQILKLLILGPFIREKIRGVLAKMRLK